MRLHFKHGVITLATVGAVLLANAGAASAEGQDPSAPTDLNIVLDNGTVVGTGQTVSFTFTGDSPSAPTGGGVTPQGQPPCDLIGEPPTYAVKGTPHFIADKDKPQSTWLLPRQKVSWTVTGSHTFTWDIGAGVELDAGAIIAKAKVKIDTKISNSWTWTGSQTVEDTNSTNAGYRATLGQVGWRLTTVKTWYARPCTKKTKNIAFDTPRVGDLSIGRESS